MEEQIIKENEDRIRYEVLHQKFFEGGQREIKKNERLR